MKKTSVYLTDEDVARLARLARVEGASQSDVIRRAIATYTPRRTRDRDFALTGTGRGTGASVADVPERELLEGFGTS